MNRMESSTAGPPAFVTTRWSQVLQARGDSPAASSALGELCEAYYAPVLAFIRHRVRDEEAARDFTQGFFARLLTRHGLDTVEPGRGRFRSFLLGAVKHFLADQYDRAGAAKRGGGQETLALEAGPDTDTGLQIPDPAGMVPEAFFDRQWALALVGRALNKLAADFGATTSSPLAAENAAGPREAGGAAPPLASPLPDGTRGSPNRRAEQFEVLKPWLVGDLESLSQAEAARRLGLTEGAVKVMIHRLRKRFRELVRSEIAHTVDDPTQVQDELRYLLEVLSQT